MSACFTLDRSPAELFIAGIKAKFHRRSVIFLCAGVALLGAMLTLVSLFRAKEPSYKGHSLSYWVISGHQNPSPEAEAAIREIGTNGIPFLLEWIQYEATPWRLKLAGAIVRLVPRAANSRLTGAITERNSFMRASGSRPALIALGPPVYTTNQLKEILTASGSSWLVKSAVADVLGNIEPHVTLPIFLSALTNANRDTRKYAARAISRFTFQYPNDPARTTLIPLFIQCLKDSEPEVVTAGISSLVALRVPTSEVLPLLTTLLSHPSPMVTNFAEVTIGRLARTHGQARTNRSDRQQIKQAERGRTPRPLAHMGVCGGENTRILTTDGHEWTRMGKMANGK